jgi:hypothetical protein
MTGFQDNPAMWRKSSASGASGCVEVAFVDGAVLVRDSKNPSGSVLQVPPSAWRRFIATQGRPSASQDAPHAELRAIAVTICKIAKGVDAISQAMLRLAPVQERGPPVKPNPRDIKGFVGLAAATPGRTPALPT